MEKSKEELVGGLLDMMANDGGTLSSVCFVRRCEYGAGRAEAKLEISKYFVGISKRKWERENI